MSVALHDIMQEFVADPRVRLAVVVDEDAILDRSGREANDQTLVRELAGVARALHRDLGDDADSTTMTFNNSVALFLHAGRASIAALGTDAVFLVYVESVWHRRRAYFLRALAQLRNEANCSERISESARRLAEPSPQPTESPSVAASASAPTASVTASRGPDLAALLRGVEALFVEYRQRDAVPPRRSIQHFAELVSEWHSICDPAIYTFPLLLDSLTQVVARDPAQKTRFSAQVQEMLAPGGLERRVS
jgi:hypothetical protein